MIRCMTVDRGQKNDKELDNIVRRILRIYTCMIEFDAETSCDRTKNIYDEQVGLHCIILLDDGLLGSTIGSFQILQEKKRKQRVLNQKRSKQTKIAKYAYTFFCKLSESHSEAHVPRFV